MRLEWRNADYVMPGAQILVELEPCDASPVGYILCSTSYFVVKQGEEVLACYYGGTVSFPTEVEAKAFCEVRYRMGV